MLILLHQVSYGRVYGKVTLTRRVGTNDNCMFIGYGMEEKYIFLLLCKFQRKRKKEKKERKTTYSTPINGGNEKNEVGGEERRSVLLIH